MSSVEKLGASLLRINTLPAKTQEVTLDSAKELCQRRSVKVKVAN
jgi:hypothetical protein